ncbi:M48 family metallopeptidase [Clostridium aestuarii]|uniref:M48 family metallopeptidase n=1 Tax=Clostridium aestuarii TaxID=338193 RepID=A0ABT4D1U7_9CLOT|nr:M48 family metallopeptidase [Clostridium aestuarii]MCY6484612.1 M48 family metallopeptidase [Clostridium aestuarii]
MILKRKYSIKIILFTLFFMLAFNNFVKDNIVFGTQNISQVSTQISKEKVTTHILNLDNENTTIGQEYYKSDRILQLLKVIFSFLIPIVILFTGFSAKLRDLSSNIGKNLFLTAGIYGVLYNLIDSVLNFPLRYYGGYLQSHIFGLSHQPFISWLKNYSISLIMSSIEIFLVLFIPYVFIKKSPKKWWIYTGVITIPITLIMYLAQPIFIDPLFNEFKPVENKQVENSLMELTKKAKIENCKILKVNKSKETSMINAYMTGIGSSKRIVLWDTAIDKLNIRELNFVMAHEIGHYVLRHNKKFIFIDILITFIVLYIINALAPSIIYKFKKNFKFTSLSNVASFPLIILILNFCFLFITPSLNAYSCYIERQADTFAIEITKDNEAAVSSFEKLSKNGIVIEKPDTLYRIWTYDHPPIKDRITFFKTYAPWQKGEKLKYNKYINEKK